MKSNLEKKVLKKNWEKTNFMQVFQILWYDYQLY